MLIVVTWSMLIELLLLVILRPEWDPVGITNTTSYPELWDRPVQCEPGNIPQLHWITNNPGNPENYSNSSANASRLLLFCGPEEWVVSPP